MCSVQRSRSIAQGGERARHELTFPRNKFHLVRGQITDVMRMVGAVGNYVFAVIGSPGPRRARKATARIGGSASERQEREREGGGRVRKRKTENEKHRRKRERGTEKARRKKDEEELLARSTPFFHGGPQFRVALLVFISREGPSREREREEAPRLISDVTHPIRFSSGGPRTRVASASLSLPLYPLSSVFPTPSLFLSPPRV